MRVLNGWLPTSRGERNVLLDSLFLVSPLPSVVTHTVRNLSLFYLIISPRSNIRLSIGLREVNFKPGEIVVRLQGRPAVSFLLFVGPPAIAPSERSAPSSPGD